MFNRRESSGHLAGWASRLFTRSLDRRIRPLDISVGQVPVLLMLAEARQLSQKELVQRAAIEQSTMAATLKRMEANDLVSRCTDPSDGRASLFSLTRKARDVLGPLIDAIDDGNRRALAGFSPDE
jgi:DNA-binding MarR family transcriptional regulator